MAQGPEYRPGWRGRFETEAGVVVADARHHARTRPPRPHEAARQAGRGRPPFEPVRETTHEWSIALIHGPRTVVRTHPNGRLFVPGVHQAFDRLEDAVAAWAGTIAAARAPRDPDRQPAGPTGP